EIYAGKIEEELDDHDDGNESTYSTDDADD
ncbi:unnamed protein product, partial [Rotaria sp. Silwood1]